MAKWIVFVALCVKIAFYSGSIKANGVILVDTVSIVNSSNSLVAWAFTTQSGLSCMLSKFPENLFSHLVSL